MDGFANSITQCHWNQLQCSLPDGVPDRIQHVGIAGGDNRVRIGRGLPESGVQVDRRVLDVLQHRQHPGLRHRHEQRVIQVRPLQFGVLERLRGLDYDVHGAHDIENSRVSFGQILESVRALVGVAENAQRGG